jgi:hypothetical protein
MCFDFLYNLFLQLFHSKKSWGTYDHKRTLIFMWGTRFFCQILMKIECYRHIFEHTQISKFIETRPVGAALFYEYVDGRTDGQRARHDEASCFTQFFEKLVKTALHSIKWLVFIIEMKSVYCAVRTGSLNKRVYAVSFKWLNSPDNF